MTKKLLTIDIKGKEYVTVNTRIKYFREHFAGYGIETNILSNEEGMCIIQATITNEKGDIVSQGLAYEKENSTFINKTSFIENCETSAVGRALGNLGIGIDGSVCSADEVVNAINNQAPVDMKSVQTEVNKCDTMEDLNVYSFKLADEQTPNFAEKKKIQKIFNARREELKTKG